MMHSTDLPSTKPYLLRAIYEWCGDNGLTPYVAVKVDASVRVPMEFVKDGEIVLNVSMDATSAMKMDNEYISFKARFGGQPREIVVPVDRVLAIYARENGQGMAFPIGEVDAGGKSSEESRVSVEDSEPPPTAPQRPGLRRIK